MFSKALFVCLLAVSLIKPNEAIFEIDTIVERAVNTLITDANNVTQGASAQTIALLTTLQNILQNATTSLNTQIVAHVNGAIASAVMAVGGARTKIANCTMLNEATITAFEISALNSIITSCITGDISTAISIISSISEAANSITNIVVNVRSKITTACPAPVAGDIFGGIKNVICARDTVALISGELTAQGVIISVNIQRASALVAKVSSIAAVLPTCISAQLAIISLNVMPVIITPVLQCTVAK